MSRSCCRRSRRQRRGARASRSGWPLAPPAPASSVQVGGWPPWPFFDRIGLSHRLFSHHTPFRKREKERNTNQLILTTPVARSPRWVRCRAEIRPGHLPRPQDARTTNGPRARSPTRVMRETAFNKVNPGTTHRPTNDVNPTPP
eukprot:4177124-Prymnesium_polylepis.1